MGEDWQVGDLALCVRSSAGEPGSKATYHIGAIYTVEEVRHGRTLLGLVFVERPVGFTGRDWICAHNFRKIRPLSDEERDSFLADLKLPEATDA